MRDLQKLDAGHASADRDSGGVSALCDPDLYIGLAVYHTLTSLSHTLSYSLRLIPAQARAAYQPPEAHPDATLTAVQKAVAELWQVEARWRVLGLPKELAATELMTELKYNPPLPGMSPLGTKGLIDRYR